MILGSIVDVRSLLGDVNMVGPSNQAKYTQKRPAKPRLVGQKKQKEGPAPSTLAKIKQMKQAMKSL